MHQSLFADGLWPSLLSLFLSGVVVMGSPGPATMGITAVGATFGFRQSLRYVAGMIVGTMLVLFAVAGGLVALLFSYPGAAPFLVGLAMTYLLHLAYKIARASPLTGTGDNARAPSFMGALLFAVVNPKAYFAIGAVYTGTTLRLGAAGHDTAVKLAVLAAVILTTQTAWLVLGASLSSVLQKPRLWRIVNLLFAGILVYSVVVTLVGLEGA
ncbi:LysE family translocator [Mangrovitalea sediminis]|uniref:LysE family translocator n=1 Tax=Mangrovitalea sediminis TaxID=1982043 RepID=UPI000BE5A952|nr:LysE family transporter [Mangrovitalea sediminis]